MFPNLPIEKVLAMHQFGFGASAALDREGAVHPGASRAPKMTTHGPTRRQVLIPLDTSTAKGRCGKFFFFFFFVQKFITRCSIAVRGRLSTTSSLHGPQGPDCPITGKRHYQYQRRNLT